MSKTSPEPPTSSAQAQESVDSSYREDAEQTTAAYIPMAPDSLVQVTVTRANGRVLLRLTAPTDFVATYSTGFTTVLHLHEILEQHAPDLQTLPDSLLDVELNGPVGGGRPALEVHGGFQNLTARGIHTQALWISKGRGTLDIRGQNLSFLKIDSFASQSQILFARNAICEESQRQGWRSYARAVGIEEQNCPHRPAWIDSIRKIPVGVGIEEINTGKKSINTEIITILDSFPLFHADVETSFAVMQKAPQLLGSDVMNYETCYENVAFCSLGMRAWFPNAYVDYRFILWEAAGNFYRMQTDVMLWKNFSPLHTDHGVLTPQMPLKQVLAILGKPAVREGNQYYWKIPGVCGENPEPEIGLNLVFDTRNQLSAVYFDTQLCVFN